MPLGHEVAAVDAGERLRDDRADAELQRGQGGVLARGTLAVVASADDEAAAPFADALAESRVAMAEGELGDRRHVGAIRHDLDAVGGQIAGGDVVVLHGDDPPTQRLLQRGVLGRRLDVGAARHLDPFGLFFRGGLDDV